MNIVILGRGSAGWIAAAPLGRIIGDQRAIELVVSDTIDTVEVGDVTIPQVLLCNSVIGLNETANDRAQPVWPTRRQTEHPGSMAEKIETCRSHGRMFRQNEELFSEVGWHQLLVCHGIMPRSYHPLADRMGDDKMDRCLAGMRDDVHSTVARVPAHREYLTRLCGTPTEVAA